MAEAGCGRVPGVGVVDRYGRRGDGLVLEDRAVPAKAHALDVLVLRVGDLGADACCSRYL